MQMSSPLRFRLEPLLDIKGLGETWRQLEANADASFFLSWSWIDSWLATIDRMPLLLSGRVGAQIVLLALLTRSQRRDLGVLPIRGASLHEANDKAIDIITIEYNGFLVARGWQGQADPAAVRYLLDHGALEELHMRGVPASAEPMFRQHGVVSIRDRKPSWRVDLQAVRASGQPYLSHLSGNTRQQIRRSIRLYQERGALCLTRAADVDEALLYLAGLQQLHQRYWEGQGQKGAFAYPFFNKFHRHLVNKGIPGKFVELVKISCADQPIGYLYNFLHHGHVLAYQSGLSYEADPKIKPGLVSHALCIEAHVASGAAVYDFMAGGSQYKASLARGGPDMIYVLVQKPTMAIKLANSARTMAKAAVRSAPWVFRKVPKPVSPAASP